MRLTTVNLITGPVTLTSNWTSAPVWAGHAVNFSVFLQFTGTPSGVFSLEYSNDANEPTGLALPVNWARIEGSQQTITEAGNHGYNVQDAGYRWVRVKYTFTASTGSLTVANYHSKGF